MAQCLKNLALQSWGPEFDPSTYLQKPGDLENMCNHSSNKAKLGGSLGFAGFRLSRVQAPGLERQRDSASKGKV